MKIALPVAGKKVCMHFGHCEEFVFIDVDEKSGDILKKESIESPPHQPGLLPQWVAENGAHIILAGGMGMRAQNLFKSHGIKVIVGCPGDDPEEVVKNYVKGTLVTVDNPCDH